MRLSDDARYLRFLVRAGEILGLSLDYQQTLQNVCAAAVETVADMCLLDVSEPQGVRLVSACHRSPGQATRLRDAGRFLQSERGRRAHVVNDVLASGHSHFVALMDDAYVREHATSDEHAQFMRELDMRSMMIVPVVSHLHGVLGTLTLARTGESGEIYDEDALLFAQELGRRCGVAISKARLYSDAINVATRLQQAALPRILPARKGLHFDAYYEPAESASLVGGDWYDAFNLPDGRIGISVGDVSGHGIDAAAFMASLRDALRTALYGSANVLRALEIADYLISEEFPDTRQATAILSLFDPKESTLICAAAGHPGPLVWLPSTREVIDPFLDRGLPLGLRSLAPSPGQKAETIRVEPGMVVVYFTDGLLEWNRDYLAGEEALKAALTREEIRNSANRARAIRHEVVRGRHLDDLAILTLSVVPEGARANWQM